MMQIKSFLLESFYEKVGVHSIIVQVFLEVAGHFLAVELLRVCVNLSSSVVQEFKMMIPQVFLLLLLSTALPDQQ